MPFVSESWVLFPLISSLGCFFIYGLRLPHIKLTTFENRAVLQIGVAAISLSTLTILASYLLGLSAPRSVPLIFGTLFFLSAVLIRVLGLYLLNHLLNRDGEQRVPMVIYGAGSAGIQMASALRQSREARPVLFIDENPALHGLMVSGLPVYAPERLPSLVARHGIKQVLIAIPSAGRNRQKKLLDQLSDLPVEVQILPSYIDMMAGNMGGNPFRPVSPDELLGREKVELDTPEIARAYAGRVIMVTGAGGSIGSELCRQLLECQPAHLILFEQSEFALYTIDRNLRDRANEMGIPITIRLGSITNKARVASVIADEGVNIILHAAAYKHVPIVEDNGLEGARNNVLGTQVVAECARAAGIERMILISTDKAVRPTNVMGATKRIAELVVQDMQTRTQKTNFSMVRFGNVLGSSGSVLPLFQAQISAGGPVTVTHEDVTRFFMTIPEAARLVLLAGAYATGSDVFVLDMGEPQKIIDIAHKMIKLSGRTVKDPQTGEGDIAIKITGLRPGEKLYEELLIDDDNLVGTPHPKILRAQEATLSELEVVGMLKELQLSLEENSPHRLHKLMARYVDGYPLVALPSATAPHQ
ncbi:polysaccharide biosynthesis protein [Ascidiaceihabitans sp.]|nr:polysaccharide biosynthesis protein [Ascidiaceihabitans sp.]